MNLQTLSPELQIVQARYPEKFQSEARAFRQIQRGARVFISTGCAQPQYLVRVFVEHVKNHPKALFDAEVLHMWTLGVAPYTEEALKANFRHNSFFIGDSTRDAINSGKADYTPIFLYQVPALFQREIIHLDAALIQVTLPDAHGYVNLGVSVDIVKAAVEQADLVIAQVNAHMPRVPGDGFIHLEQIDFILPFDEPILQFAPHPNNEVVEGIGKHVAGLIQDGDTIQVGYGSTPDAVVAHLHTKKDLGIHTELLTDGLVKLIKAGNVSNRYKTINRGRTVASFCMGTQESYDYIHNNPSIEFRTVDYTNNPLIIARHENMVAINGALQIDLTGQSCAESIGRMFYSGIGGQADFMRGAIYAPNGKSIVTLPATTDSNSISRIVPLLKEGSGVTLNRGDVHYIVTEYGIAYLHGKNIRERAMALIAIAHPDFRPWLIEEAKRLGLIYRDQAFIPGDKGIYPEKFETFRMTKKGLEIFLRPVKISDEPLIKDFFYDLSEESLYRRFMSVRKDMPHERLQEFVVIDYTKDMVVLAFVLSEDKEELIGMGEYHANSDHHTAEASFTIKNSYQGRGVGTEILIHLTHIAKKHGFLGFTAETLFENMPMLKVFEKTMTVERSYSDGVYNLRMMFRQEKRSKK